MLHEKDEIYDKGGYQSGLLLEWLCEATVSALKISRIF